MKKIFFLWIACLGIFCPAFSTSNLNDSLLLNSVQMYEDIDHYYQTLKKESPGIYARYSKETLDSVIYSLKENCRAPLTLEEFNLYLAKTNKFFDGHTGVRIRFLKGSKEYFPFVGFSAEGLTLGRSTILKIEKVEAKEVAKDLDQMQSWEDNEKFRVGKMNDSLNKLLQSYNKLSSPYTCIIRNNDTGIVKDTVIDVLGWNEWYKYSNPSYTKELYQRDISFELFPQESIAVIHYNTCKSPEDEYVYYNELLNFFTKLNELRIENLFIDVSQNVGGSDNTNDFIFKYLKSEPYQLRVVENSPMNADSINDLVVNQLKGLDYKNKTKEELVQIVKELERYLGILGEVLKTGVAKESYAYEIKGNSDGFDGKVYTIMGTNTYSAAADFCEEFKRRKMGIWVGEELGQRFPFGGNGREGILPNSELRFYYSSSYFQAEPNVSNHEGFIQPDIPYALTKPIELDDLMQILQLSDSIYSE